MHFSGTGIGEYNMEERIFGEKQKYCWLPPSENYGRLPATNTRIVVSTTRQVSSNIGYKAHRFNLHPLQFGNWDWGVGENVHLYFIKLNNNANAASIVAALFSLMN